MFQSLKHKLKLHDFSIKLITSTKAQDFAVEGSLGKIMKVIQKKNTGGNKQTKMHVIPVYLTPFATRVFYTNFIRFLPLFLRATFNNLITKIPNQTGQK